MITITVTSDAFAARAESVMSREVLHNPNLNGADYRIKKGDFNSIDGGDAIVCAQLYASIFKNEDEDA